MTRQMAETFNHPHHDGPVLVGMMHVMLNKKRLAGTLGAECTWILHPDTLAKIDPAAIPGFHAEARSWGEPDYPRLMDAAAIAYADKYHAPDAPMTDTPPAPRPRRSRGRP